MALDAREPGTKASTGSVQLIDLTEQEPEAPFAVRDAVDDLPPERAETLFGPDFRQWMVENPVYVGIATGLICFIIISAAVSAVSMGGTTTGSDDPVAGAASSDTDANRGSFEGSAGANFTSDSSKLSRAGAGKGAEETATAGSAETGTDSDGDSSGSGATDGRSSDTGEEVAGPVIGNDPINDDPLLGNDRTNANPTPGRSTPNSLDNDDDLDASGTVNRPGSTSGSGTGTGSSSGAGTTGTTTASRAPSNNTPSSSYSPPSTSAGNSTGGGSATPTTQPTSAQTQATTAATAGTTPAPSPTSTSTSTTAAPQTQTPATNPPSLPTLSIAAPSNGATLPIDTPTSFAANLVSGATQYCWSFIQNGSVKISGCSAGTTYTLPANPDGLAAGAVTVTATATGPFGTVSKTINISLYRSVIISTPQEGRSFTIGRGTMHVGVTNLSGANSFCFRLVQGGYNSGDLCYSRPGVTFKASDPIWDSLSPGSLTIYATIRGSSGVLATDSVTVTLE